MKKVIIILSVILVILIVATILIGRFALQRGKDTGARGEIPTSDLSTETQGLRPPTASDRVILQSLKDELPFETDDFVIDYATAEGELDQFIVTKLNEDADEKIQKWFAQRGLSRINYRARSTTPINPFIFIDNTEDEFTEKDEQGIPSSTKDVELLTDLLKTLILIEDVEVPTQAAPTSTPTPTRSAPQQPSGTSAQDILNNSRIKLSASARADLRAGVVDKRLLNIVGMIVRNHTIAISVFRYQRIKKVNPHYFGRAVDIYMVDGSHVSSSNSSARRLIEMLIALPNNSTRPNEIGIPAAWADLVRRYRKPGFALFARSDHNTHLHIAFSR